MCAAEAEPVRAGFSGKNQLIPVGFFVVNRINTVPFVLGNRVRNMAQTDVGRVIVEYPGKDDPLIDAAGASIRPEGIDEKGKKDIHNMTASGRK